MESCHIKLLFILLYQTFKHIFDSSLLTKFAEGLQFLHNGDDEAASVIMCQLHHSHNKNEKVIS